jgi:hypothetical protein
VEMRYFRTIVLLSVSAVAEGVKEVKTEVTAINLRTRGIRIFDKCEDGLEGSTFLTGSGDDTRFKSSL